jgi:hypothetical protein
MRLEEVGGKLPVYIGIGAFSHAGEFASPVQLIDQVNLTRDLGGDGFIVYHLNQSLLDVFLPALREGVTATDAIMPREGLVQ